MPTEVHLEYTGTRYLMLVEEQVSYLPSSDRLRDYLQEHYGDIIKQEISLERDRELITMSYEVLLRHQPTQEDLRILTSLSSETIPLLERIGQSLQDTTPKDSSLIYQEMDLKMQINSTDFVSLLSLLFYPPILKEEHSSPQEESEESSAQQPTEMISPVPVVREGVRVSTIAGDLVFVPFRTAPTSSDSQHTEHRRENSIQNSIADCYQEIIDEFGEVTQENYDEYLRRRRQR